MPKIKRSTIIFFLLLSVQLRAIPNNLQRPLFLAHFMPWYQAPPVNKTWGWHWTMNHFDPEKMDENNRREIASHFYPLTGPYDSRDAYILEYQTLIMKIAGIDGVLVDWYGMADFADYKVLNESTQRLFEWTSKGGLYFAIVYEDQTVRNMIDGGYIKSSQALPHGKEVMDYLNRTWFEQDSYVKLDGRPVLLTFGPQYFTKSSDWDNIFSGLTLKPVFFTLHTRLAPVASGAYPWPPMWKSNSKGILTEQALNSYLHDFYNQSASWDYLVAGAFPGFYDIYKQAGAGDGYGYLDPMDTHIFESTLGQAMAQDPDVIQLITWNDYGEGTIIEPTVEFEYKYLEIVQQNRISTDTTFHFQPAQLRLPLQIYNLRLEHKSDDPFNLQLDQVFNLIISGQIDSAIYIMDKLTNPDTVHPIKVGRDFKLMQNNPNPFNHNTSISYIVSRAADVRIAIYNIKGQLVDTLLDAYQKPGSYSVQWDARACGAGMYFFVLSNPQEKIFGKCIKLD